jgi:hypothetical protein
MEILSKKLPSNTSLLILLGLSVFAAIFFSSAMKAQSVAVSWLDDADLRSAEVGSVKHR